MKPSPPWREDLITSLLATTLVAGLFLDGWNHINLQNTPLFYYMLNEASLVPDTDMGKNSGGFHLGPVGGRIVAEVVIGLLQADPASYIVQQPGWMPTLQKPGTAFRMTDFLTFAGVDPATRHAQKPDLA